jgi:hypothetical protein
MYEDPGGDSNPRSYVLEADAMIPMFYTFVAYQQSFFITLTENNVFLLTVRSM